MGDLPFSSLFMGFFDAFEFENPPRITDRTEFVGSIPQVRYLFEIALVRIELPQSSLGFLKCLVLIDRHVA